MECKIKEGDLLRLKLTGLRHPTDDNFRDNFFLTGKASGIPVECPLHSFLPKSVTKNLPDDKLCLYCSELLGQEFDFFVTHIQADRITVSKTEADRKKEKAAFFGEHPLKVGDLVEAAVFHVDATDITVDVSGVLTKLSFKDISKSRLNELDKFFYPGEPLPVVIKECVLNPEKKKVSRLRVSRVETQELKRRERIKNYSVGDYVFGQVIYTSEFACEVRLPDGLSVIAALREDTPFLSQGDPLCIEIKKIDQKRTRLYGEIFARPRRSDLKIL